MEHLPALQTHDIRPALSSPSGCGRLILADRELRTLRGALGERPRRLFDTPESNERTSVRAVARQTIERGDLARQIGFDLTERLLCHVRDATGTHRVKRRLNDQRFESQNWWIGHPAGVVVGTGPGACARSGADPGANDVTHLLVIALERSTDRLNFSWRFAPGHLLIVPIDRARVAGTGPISILSFLRTFDTSGSQPSYEVGH